MRPARARIDLHAFAHNYQLARRLGGQRALAVIKADAYGHGAIACARALEGVADGFGVACIEEALELRAAGIRAPILLLEGFFDADELPLIEQHQLWTVIASHWQLEMLQRHRAAQPWTVWLKLDSGMHRLGFAPSDYVSAYQQLRALPWIQDIIAMTHLARADELACPYSAQQLDAFDEALAQLPPAIPSSIANSAALLSLPQSRREWARPGLMLYGAQTLDGPNEAAQTLRPVMHLTSAIIDIRELAAGEPIGYGGTFVTTQPTRVGVVALGYADGYPQDAPEGTPVLVCGQRTRLIGRVSMDMLTIDLTDIPQAAIGSPVEFWGAQVPVSEVARHTRSSPYRLLSNLKRVKRESIVQ